MDICLGFSSNYLGYSNLDSYTPCGRHVNLKASQCFNHLYYYQKCIKITNKKIVDEMKRCLSKNVFPQNQLRTSKHSKLVLQFGRKYIDRIVDQ